MFIWAHRGASGDYPENTLLAFEQAVVQQASGIELDVFQVEDELFVWHDRYLPAGMGTEAPVWRQQKSTLQAIRIDEQHGVPTLRQALAVIAGRVSVNIELKRVARLDLLAEVLSNAVQRQGFSPTQLLLSSFYHEYLLSMRQLNWPYPLGVITASSAVLMKETLSVLAPFSVHFNVNCIDACGVQFCKDMGYQCYVYTVDRPADVRLLLALGVDGVFSNYPAQTAELVATLR